MVQFFFTLIRHDDGSKSYDYARTVNGHLDLVVRAAGTTAALAAMHTKLAQRQAQLAQPVIH